MIRGEFIGDGDISVHMVSETIRHAGGEVLEWKWSSNSKLMERPFWTSAYLVDRTLIDCGAPASADEICAFIDGLSPSDRPVQCLVTHAHEDHAGTGKALIEKYGIVVFAPAASVPRLQADWTYPDYRKMTWGESGFAGFEARPYPPSIDTPRGYHFDVVQLPGHAPDLHALVEKRHQWAFTGDMMLPQYQMLFGGPSDIQENIKIIAESLQKLHEFTAGMDELLIFVSGRGVYQGRHHIRERIAEIHALHEKVHALNNQLDPRVQGSRRMRKLLQALFGGESFFGGMTGGALSRENLVASLLKWEL